MRYGIPLLLLALPLSAALATPRLDTLLKHPLGYEAVHHPVFRKKLESMLGGDLAVENTDAAKQARSERLSAISERKRGQVLAQLLDNAIQRAALDSHPENALQRELDRQFVEKPMLKKTRVERADVLLGSEADLWELLEAAVTKINRAHPVSRDYRDTIEISARILRTTLLKDVDSSRVIGIESVRSALLAYNHSIDFLPSSAIEASTRRTSSGARLGALADLESAEDLAVSSEELGQLYDQLTPPLQKSIDARKSMLARHDQRLLEISEAIAELRSDLE